MGRCAAKAVTRENAEVEEKIGMAMDSG